METFLVRVGIAILTHEKVQALLKDLMRSAVAEATEHIREVVDEIPERLSDIQRQTVDRVDAMDGKMGNLQQQLTDIPGQIIEGIANRINIPGIGGLFGQR